MDEYQVVYTQSVIDFMMREIESERVYNKVNEYREILALFPDIGHECDPYYDAARPPFLCKFVAIPDTPFTLYYVKDEARQCVTVFFIEHQRTNPRTRFTGASSKN